MRTLSPCTTLLTATCQLSAEGQVPGAILVREEQRRMKFEWECKTSIAKCCSSLNRKLFDGTVLGDLMSSVLFAILAFPVYYFIPPMR